VGKQYTSSRRKLLAKTGITLGALLWSGEVASAEADQDHVYKGSNGQSKGIKVVNNRFVFDVDRDNMDHFKYKIFKNAVEDFNKALENDHIKLDNSSISPRTRTNTPTTSEQPGVKIQSSVSEMIESDE
jgi:hypothetical protein